VEAYWIELIKSKGYKTFSIRRAILVSQTQRY